MLESDERVEVIRYKPSRLDRSDDLFVEMIQFKLSLNVHFKMTGTLPLISIIALSKVNPKFLAKRAVA
jgi:hypothetical protein